MHLSDVQKYHQIHQCIRTGTKIVMVTGTYRAGRHPPGSALGGGLIPAAKLGAHHLAYLRAVVEGLPQSQAAVRYLGHDPCNSGPALRKIHQALVDRVRALARRQGDPRWRLVGLSIKPLVQHAAPPSMTDWASALGLDDFGHAELLALYQEAFPADRRAARNSRLRAQQLSLLQSLAGGAAEIAQPLHRLDAWFPAHLCRSLAASGLVLLRDLQGRVQAGGRWWATIPRIGVGKAERLRQHLALLLPDTALAPASAALATRGRQLAALMCPALPLAGGRAPATLAEADDTVDVDKVPWQAPGAARDLTTDLPAVRAWLLAHAGSDATAKTYSREMLRLVLFLDQQALCLSRCDAEVCLAYQALLQHPPAGWTGKRSAPLGHAAWRPFSGPLSPRSQRHAVAVVSACFAWLSARGYLLRNPWHGLAQARAPAQGAGSPTDRVLSPVQWAAILRPLEAWSASEAAAERMVFLLHFLQATGLRAAELLRARVGDLTQQDGAWLLRVPAKGKRQRLIPVMGEAERALVRYLGARGLGWDAVAQQPDLPLLASISRPAQHLSYRSLYGSMKHWLKKAIEASSLPWQDQMAAARASPHWLRRACGVQALARGLAPNTVGQCLGHAHPRSSAAYPLAEVGLAVGGTGKVPG